jgi:hypothetical protein
MLIIAYIITIAFFTAIFTSGRFTFRHLLASLILISLLVVCYFYNYEAALLKQQHICEIVKTKSISYHRNDELLSIGNERKSYPEFTRDCHLRPWLYNIMDMFMFTFNLNF